MPKSLSRSNIFLTITATLFGIIASAITIWQFIINDNDDNDAIPRISYFESFNPENTWGAGHIDGQELSKVLEANNGKVIHLTAELPQDFSRFEEENGDSLIYELCNADVPNENAQGPFSFFSYPLAPGEIISNEEFECGEPWLLVRFDENNRLLDNTYPTLVSYKFEGNYRIQSVADYVNTELRTIYELIPVTIVNN